MRYLTWILRALLFLLLLGFAVKNDQEVALRYFFGFEWQTSLIVLLLCFFVGGVALGLLAMLGSQFRLRRELSSVRKELKAQHKPADQDEPAQPPPTTPETLS